MSSQISEIPFFNRTNIPDWQLLSIGLLYAIPLGLLLLWKPVLGIAFGFAPLAFLLVCHGYSLVYFLIIATFIYFPIGTRISLLPCDIMATLLVIAYIVDLLVKGTSKRKNHIAGYYFAYVLVLLISIALEGFTFLSVKFFIRQVLLFSTFMAVAHFAPRLQIKYVFGAFMGAALLNSLLSLDQFLLAGGNVRAFGLAGKGYADHVMIGLLIAAAYYLWSTDIRKKIFWASSALIMLGALAATQTRASAITAGFGLIIILYCAVTSVRRIQFRVPRKNLMIAIVLSLFSIIILAVYTPVFDGILYRFGRMGFQASGTILLRISLWTAGIKAFLGNPIFGIGAGNFAQVSQWVPGVRFDMLYYMVSGMSTHAILVTVLAETGLFGLVTISLFFSKTFSTALFNFRNSGVSNYSTETLCLLAIAGAIVFSSIYAGAWFWGNNSFHMAVFFGLIASFKFRDESPIRGNSLA